MLFFYNFDRLLGQNALKFIKNLGGEMYRHKKFYDVKYTDADAYDNLKPSALLSFMEESACLSADELGFGY